MIAQAGQPLTLEDSKLRGKDMTQTVFKVLLIGSGAFIGANLRYWTTQLLLRYADYFPWATLTVNAAGSFILGASVIVLGTRPPWGNEIAGFLNVGLLGALTTFSTFSVETLYLLRENRPLPAMANIAVNVALALLLAAAGMAAAGWVLRDRLSFFR